MFFSFKWFTVAFQRPALHINLLIRFTATSTWGCVHIAVTRFFLRKRAWSWQKVRVRKPTVNHGHRPAHPSIARRGSLRTHSKLFNALIAGLLLFKMHSQPLLCLKDTDCDNEIRPRKRPSAGGRIAVTRLTFLVGAISVPYRSTNTADCNHVV